MKRILDESSVALISYLMSVPEISDKVLNDQKNKDKYKFYTIRTDGTIVFGKVFLLSTGFSKFWCQLLNCQDKIPFESWALKVWDALIDISSGNNAKALSKGLSTEIAEKAQREGEYAWVIRRLVDCYEHVCNNKKSEPSSAEDLGKSGPRVAERASCNDNHDIIVNVNGVKRKVINLTDSIGDPFIDIVFEPTVRLRGGV